MRESSVCFDSDEQAKKVSLFCDQLTSSKHFQPIYTKTSEVKQRLKRAKHQNFSRSIFVDKSLGPQRNSADSSILISSPFNHPGPTKKKQSETYQRPLVDSDSNLDLDLDAAFFDPTPSKKLSKIQRVRLSKKDVFKVQSFKSLHKRESLGTQTKCKFLPLIRPNKRRIESINTINKDQLFKTEASHTLGKKKRVAIEDPIFCSLANNNMHHVAKPKKSLTLRQNSLSSNSIFISGVKKRGKKKGLKQIHVSTRIDPNIKGLKVRGDSFCLRPKATKNSTCLVSISEVVGISVYVIRSPRTESETRSWSTR